MKRKVICFLLALFTIAIFSLGCGGGGGSHSNPASPVISGNAKISGKIVDSSNKPVKDLNVRLALVSNPALNTLPESLKTTLRLATSGTQTEFNTTTDSNGVYTFDNVPYGRYSLSANAGATGILRAVTADNGTSGSFTDTLQPFATLTGKVETNDSTPIAVYGAMVSLADNEGSIFEGNGYRSFTDSDGVFTLKYIPVETEYQLVTTLQGYEAVDSTKPTTPFTIPVSGLVYTEDIYPTYSMVNNPIKLKASVVNSFSVPATVTTSLTSSQFPLLVIAQDVNDSNNVFYNVAKEGDASCTLRITKASTYKICAIDSTGKESKREEFSVDKTDIPGERSVLLLLTFESSTQEDKTVNITKVALPDSDYNENTLNYYDGYVSFIEQDSDYIYEMFCCEAFNSDGNSSANNAITLEQEAAVVGKYAVSCSQSASDGETNVNIYDENHNEPVATISPIASVDSIYINRIGFVPHKYLGVGYSSGCDSYKFYVDAIKYNDSDSKYNGETKRYYYGDGNELHASDIKMVMHEDDYCYMAVLYYSNQSVLNIYKVGDASALVSYQLSNTSNPMNLKDFQVLKNGNFYVEASSSDSSGQTTVSTTAYIFSSGATSPIATSTSARKGCFVDSNNNMYRYDPSELAVVKTATLDGDPIDRYKIQTATTSGQSPTEDNVNGVLGYIETDDGIEVFVY